MSALKIFQTHESAEFNNSQTWVRLFLNSPPDSDDVEALKRFEQLASVLGETAVYKDFYVLSVGRYDQMPAYLDKLPALISWRKYNGLKKVNEFIDGLIEKVTKQRIY